MVPSMLRSHEPDDHYISVTFFYWTFLLMEYINYDILQIAMGGKMNFFLLLCDASTPLGCYVHSLLQKWF